MSHSSGLGVSLVVLAKHADGAKRRLGLPAQESQKITRRLAASTIRTAMAARSVEAVLVVTSDPAIAEDATEAGVLVVAEGRPLGMIRAADLGRRRALDARPSAAVAVLVADLPAFDLARSMQWWPSSVNRATPSS